MATNLQKWFGLTVEVNRDIPKDKYLDFKRKMEARIHESGLDRRRVGIFIQHISIHETPTAAYQRLPMSEKLNKLSVRIEPSGKAKKVLKFGNHELKVPYREDIKTRSREGIITYELPGNFCEQHKEFDDYIAIFGDLTIYPAPLRRLTISVTAHATSSFRAFWRNDTTGSQNTKLNFELYRDIQLTF